MKKINKKTLIIIGIVTVVLVLIVILVTRNKEDETNQENNNDLVSGNTISSNAGVTLLPERGYPIYKGVSKRKEVYDLQSKLKNDYKAQISLDGVWGNQTETAVLKYLKKNNFNSYGELLATYGANPPASTNTSAGVLNVIEIVQNWFN